MRGDRNNTIRAPRPRRAGRTACLAAGLSLAAIGFAFTSLPVHGEPPTTAPATAPAERSNPADAEAQPAAQPMRGARVRDGRPTTGPGVDAAAIPWAEIAEFMGEHSRLKWQRWEQYERMNP